ncbi:hypothetical protein ACSBR2_017951 [Camellia fascicularis]
MDFFDFPFQPREIYKTQRKLLQTQRNYELPKEFLWILRKTINTSPEITKSFQSECILFNNIVPIAVKLFLVALAFRVQMLLIDFRNFRGKKKAKVLSICVNFQNHYLQRWRLIWRLLPATLTPKISAPESAIVSACWAMAKSWLDVQVDLELARLQPGGMDQFKTYEDAIDRSHGQGDGVSPSTVGPENWPLQVLNQQPRHLSALLQKLHSSDSVHEAITQECKEQHRQIEEHLLSKRL